MGFRQLAQTGFFGKNFGHRGTPVFEVHKKAFTIEKNEAAV